MKFTITILLALVAVALGSTVFYHLGYEQATQKMMAAHFYDTYRATAHNAYFVAQGREDAYFWSITPVMNKYPELLQANADLAIPASERALNETLVARYYFARGEALPAATAALFSSPPDKASVKMPEIPSREKIRALLQNEPVSETAVPK